MRLLFLTMVKIDSLETRGIYTDLLNKFKEEGHEIVIVSPTQRRNKERTSQIEKNGVTFIKVKTLNVEKTNIIEKGFGQLSIERLYLSAIKKYCKNIKFDLVLYSTPPITFSKAISYIKKRDGAYSYLLLKDIFPQNAVDLKMMKAGGFLHKFFLKKERKLYEISDTIGCMSPANVDYVLKHNPYISSKKVEENPNTIVPIKLLQTEAEKKSIRKKYNLPLDKKIFVYGGNLGAPQGVDFLIKTIENAKYLECYFLIVGSGTKFVIIENWFERNKPTNAKLLSAIPKEDYDTLLQSCDFGMIFLHPDFTIPNFPSRLLSYLEMELPIIAATDISTDIGKIIESHNCGYWARSGDILQQIKNITSLLKMQPAELANMKTNANKLLQSQYTIHISYDAILARLNTKKS